MKHLKWWMLPIGIILLVAAYLRLYDIAGYMTFLGDEGRDVLVVKRMIVDGKFTLLGPTASVGGFFLGPIYYYFMLPFLWLWKLDPVGPAVMVALFGVATVYAVFHIGKTFFHPVVGLIAASVYALSPVVIAYSRSSWNPNLVPFFATILLFCLWLSSESKKIKPLFWAGIALGIGLQLHYLFLFVFPVTGIWILLQRKRLDVPKGIFLLLLGFLIGYAPFLAFELRHGFPNTRSIIQFLLAGKETGFSAATFFTTVEDVVFRSFGRLLFRLPEGGIWNKIPQLQLTAWIVGTRTFIFTSFVMLILAATKKLPLLNSTDKTKFARAASLMLLWLVTVVILFGFYRKGIYDYYFAIIFPMPFLLLGMLTYYLGKFRIGLIVGFVLWAGLLYFNWQGRPFIYPPNNQLAQAKFIASETLSHTDGKPFNFALITNGNSDHTYRYFFEIAGQKPVVIENDVIDPDRKTVTDQLIVICEQADCKPVGHPLWEIAGFGQAEITGTWDVSFVKIFRLVHYTQK